MNIQIFGTNKSFDTKKAQRWFKERGIRFQMIDMKEKGMSRGEFDNVCRAVGGWAKLVDENAKDKDTLALLKMARREPARPTSCSRTSSSSASPLCATADRPP
ncbi:arsenate reductase family protein [Gemmiger formicilis]|uniref:arsenate reductase family protein n=1 Tax=Gemmiger formicilis TaxID=745368 RepID=UPI00399BB232